LAASIDEKRARFDAQVLPHLDAAHRFARWLARSPGDADDILQDAVLRAFRGFDGLRGSDGKAWLLTIVRNCYSTTMQQQRRRAYVPLPADHDEQDGHAMIATTPDPETASIHQDQERTLERLLATLPDEHREVLVLREIEGLGYRQIAAVTNVPLGTVMSRLARARAALKTRWQQQIEGEPRAVR
jgi:RNA polymerase sigma factor (sigma-70 family)